VELGLGGVGELVINGNLDGMAASSPSEAVKLQKAQRPPRTPACLNVGLKVALLPNRR